VAIEAASRRRAIDNVASALFRDRGYAATSVRDIARALDIRGASLYAHVTSKEDVLWSIVDRAAAAFEAAADAAAEAAANPASVGEADTTADAAVGELGTIVAPARELAALVRAHVAVIASDPQLAGVFVREWRHLTGERRIAVLARRDAYEARFRAIVEAGVASGDFAPTDPALAASYLLSALNGLAAWYRPGGRLTATAIADQYADYAVRSLTEDHR